MILDKLLTKTTLGLEKYMNLTFNRNQAITSNIVNAETPGYRAVDFYFSNELDGVLGENYHGGINKTNPQHLDVSDPSPAHMIHDYSGATKPDGNNVDIDIEMGRLAYNSSQYMMAATYLREQLGMLKRAIRNSR